MKQKSPSVLPHRPEIVQIPERNMHYYFVKCGMVLGQRRQLHLQSGELYSASEGLRSAILDTTRHIAVFFLSFINRFSLFDTNEICTAVVSH